MGAGDGAGAPSVRRRSAVPAAAMADGQAGSVGSCPVHGFSTLSTRRRALG